jgi:chloride channel 3/4/5
MSMSELIKRLVSQCRGEDMIDLWYKKKQLKFQNFLLLFMCFFSDYPSAKFSDGKSKGALGTAGPGVHRAIWQLFFALVVQVALVTFTIGVKVPSGLIIPSMSIGAITGRIIGIITEQLAFQNQKFILFRNDCNNGKLNKTKNFS